MMLLCTVVHVLRWKFKLQSLAHFYRADSSKLFTAPSHNVPESPGPSVTAFPTFNPLTLVHPTNPPTQPFHMKLDVQIRTACQLLSTSLALHVPSSVSLVSQALSCKALQFSLTSSLLPPSLPPAPSTCCNNSVTGGGPGRAACGSMTRAAAV
eukprot:2576512-Rhodomonas_salina.2